MANGDKTQQQPLNYQQSSDIQFLLNNILNVSEQPVEEVVDDKPVEIPNLSYQNFKKLFEKADDSLFLGYEGAVSDKLKELYPHLVTVPWSGVGRDIIAIKNPETKEVREFNLGDINLKTQEGLDALQTKYEEIAVFVNSTSNEFKNTPEGQIFELTGIHDKDDYGVLSKPKEGTNQPIEGVNVIGGIQTWDTTNTLDQKKLNSEQQLDLSQKSINKLKSIIKDPTIALPNYNKQKGIKVFPFSPNEIKEVRNHIYEEIIKEDEYKNLTRESFEKIFKNEQLFRTIQNGVVEDIDRENHQNELEKLRGEDGNLDDALLDKEMQKYLIEGSDNSVKVEWDKIPETPLGSVEGDNKKYNLRTAVKTLARNSHKLEDMHEELMNLQENPTANSDKIKDKLNGIKNLNKEDDALRTLIGKENLQKYIGDYFTTAGYTQEMIKNYKEFQGTVPSLVEEKIANNPEWSPRDALKSLLITNVAEGDILDKAARERMFTFNLTDDITEQTFKKILLARTGVRFGKGLKELIQNKFDDHADKIKGNTATLSYSDLEEMGLDYKDFNNWMDKWSHLVDEKDLNWMRVHSNTKAENDVERSVLFNQSILNKSILSYEKPTTVLTHPISATSRSALRTIGTEWFGMNQVDADKMSSSPISWARGDDGNIDHTGRFLIDKTQEAISKYNSVHSKEIKKGDLQPLELSDEEIEYVARSSTENFTDQLGGFMPILAQLGAISLATEGLGTIPAVATSLRAWRLLAKRSTFAKVSWHVGAGFLEEAKMQLAGFKPGAGISFYGIGLAAAPLKLSRLLPIKSSFIKTLDPAFETLFKTGVIGATAMKTAGIAEAVIDAWYFKESDLDTSLDEMFGNHEDLIQQTILDVLTFNTIGVARYASPFSGAGKIRRELYYPFLGSERMNKMIKQLGKEMDEQLDVVEGKGRKFEELSKDEQIELIANGFKSLVDAGVEGIPKGKSLRDIDPNTDLPYGWEMLNSKQQNIWETKRDIILSAKRFKIAKDSYEKLTPPKNWKKATTEEQNKFKDQMNKLVFDPMKQMLKEYGRGKNLTGKDITSWDFNVEFTTDRMRFQKDLITNKDIGNTAEFDPTTNTMRFDPNLYTPGKPIHEFLHKALSSYLNVEENKLIKANFHANLRGVFGKQQFKMIGGKYDGKLISDLIISKYGEKGKPLDLTIDKDRETFNEEYFAHILEQMANPEFYYKHTAPTIIKELKQDFRHMMEEGILGGRIKWKYNPPRTVKDLVQLMGRLSYGTRTGRAVNVKLRTLMELDKISLLDVELSKTPKRKGKKGSIDLSKNYVEASEKLTKEYDIWKLDNMKKNSPEKQKMSEVLALDWEIAIRKKVTRMLPNSQKLDVERIASQFITSSSWGTGKRGLPDLINEYSKDVGYGIEKWIGELYGERLKEHTRGQVFMKSIDVKPESGRPMTETLAGGEPTPTDIKIVTTPKPKSNLLTENLTENKKKLIGNKKKKTIKNSILRLKPKEIPSLLEGISKPAPKSITKVVDEITGKGVEENKAFVNENWSESKKAFPPFNNGIGGKSLGVPPVMLKLFYNMLEGTASGKHRGAGDKSGDTAGNPWQGLRSGITKQEMFDFLKFDKKPGETGYSTGRARWTTFKQFLAKKILNQELEMMEKNGELPSEISNELTNNNVIAEIVSSNQSILGSRLTTAILKMPEFKDPIDLLRGIARLPFGIKKEKVFIIKKLMDGVGLPWGKKSEKIQELTTLERKEEVESVNYIEDIAIKEKIDIKESSYDAINKDKDYRDGKDEVSLQAEQKIEDINTLTYLEKLNGYSYYHIGSAARSVLRSTLGTNSRGKKHILIEGELPRKMEGTKGAWWKNWYKSPEGKKIFREATDKELLKQAEKDFGAVLRVNTQVVRSKISHFIKQLNKPFDYRSEAEKNLALANYARDLLTSKKINPKTGERYTYAETQAANKLLSKRWIQSVYEAAKKRGGVGYALSHMGMQTNIRDGIFKALAYNVQSIANRGSKPTEKNDFQEFHWEHQRQLLNNTNLIIKAIKKHLKAKTSIGFGKTLDKILETSQQALIPKDLQMKNDKLGKTTFSDIYGKDGKVTITDNSIFNVLTNSSEAKTQIMIDGKYHGKTALDAITAELANKTLHKVIQKIHKKEGRNKVDADLLNLEQQVRLEIKSTTKEMAKGKGVYGSRDLSNVELTDLLQQRAEAIAKLRDLNAKHKGASVLDFDETVALTKSRIKYEIPRHLPDGRFNPAVVGYGAISTKGRLTPAEFAKRHEQLTKYGAKFDFSEFTKVIGGKKGPLFKKLEKIQSKYGTENTFILTARPPEAAPAIKRFLKELGIDVPLKNIIGLENGTPGAKANFFIKKTAEGYNDYYFVDDVLQNVNAVKKTLDILGVSGKVRQTKIQASKDLNKDFNKILQETTGIEKWKKYSRGTAKTRGADIGKWKWWLPPSAQGFLDLMYPTFGKGKQGDGHMKWFDKTLGRPYARGFYELNKSKQRVQDDYEALKKQYPNIKKVVNKDSGYHKFTNDAAMRVYLWNKNGMDIPELSKRDVKELVKLVKSNPELQSYADQVSKLTQLKEGYVKPAESWLAKSIQHDLLDVSNKVGRKQFFKEWIDNKNTIFSEATLNKLESTFGSKYRSALEDMLYRMEHGHNVQRKSTDKEKGFSKWIANATGTVMFLNRRSALTQSISMLNFMNWRDNGPIAIGKSFANQKQFWKDFSMIWNSPMLKQRRKGLTMDVNYEEIVNTMEGKKDKVSAGVSYMLHKGFIFTKLMDNWAIAFGGSSFYRNRLNTHLKYTKDKVEAKKKAFIDFQEASEPTQQSSRPDLISQEQASPWGRFLLTFQNVTMQNNRNGKRAVLDFVNRRGDMKTNISKIVYYFGVQNMIFLGMQQALFAAYWDDDATDADRTKKHLKIGNGLLDIYLRGGGMYGVAISTIKNTILKYMEESEKGWKGSEAKVLIEALNLSPPVGSKLRKLHTAMVDRKYNKDSIVKPLVLAAEGFTNIPFHEFFEMVDSGVALTDDQLQAWQKVAIALGYPEWQVDYQPKKDNAPKVTYSDN